MPEIDDLRDAQIRLHGLANLDCSYTFYYDETNNIRKLSLDAQGLNVATLKVFVLGGIVHEGAPRVLDIQALRNAMRIQSTAHEIKLEHVARGGFLELLRSAKLTTFLHWLAENKLMIHSHDVDPLYWSVVDIIDSILPRLGNLNLLQYHMLLKGDLTMVLRSDLTATTDLFYKYGYPSLAPQDRKSFLNDLIALLERNSAVLPSFNETMLKGVLQTGLGLTNLAFIEGETPHLLLDDFSIFYLNRISLFKYAQHVFDMEESIRKCILEAPLTNRGEPVTHYRFADSRTEPGIQISDIVVGLLGKMYSFFADTPREEVALAPATLTGTSLQNAELLRDLIAASHDANIAFLHHVASSHDIDKLDLFLRFRDGSYAV